MNVTQCHTISTMFTQYFFKSHQKAIATLYSSQDSKKQSEAQIFLQQIQNEPCGWDIGLELLDSLTEKTSYSVFVGALILQTKISKEW